MKSNIFKILILEDNGSSFQIGNGMSLLDEKAIRDAKWAETYERSSPERLTLSKDVYIKILIFFQSAAEFITI